jgi:hypothetical protein
MYEGHFIFLNVQIVIGSDINLIEEAGVNMKPSAYRQ